MPAPAPSRCPPPRKERDAAGDTSKTLIPRCPRRGHLAAAAQLLQLHFDIVVELAHIPRRPILLVVAGAADPPCRGSHGRRGGSGAHPAAAGRGAPSRPPLSRQLMLILRHYYSQILQGRLAQPPLCKRSYSGIHCKGGSTPAALTEAHCKGGSKQQPPLQWPTVRAVGASSRSYSEP